MEFHVKRFKELTLNELYNILKLRNEVFVVEQNCPYIDIDDKDQKSIHIFALNKSKVTAYTRIVRNIRPAIGRVIVAEELRGKGYARQMIRKAMDVIKSEYGDIDIKLQAQTYLLPFYESFGFEPISEEYLEDGIPHRDMLKKA